MVEHKDRSLSGRTALITGAARRIGAAIAEKLHGAGANVAIHFRGSGADAEDLSARLNRSRAGSARCFQADLLAIGAPERLLESVLTWHGGLDVLVNNASSFYPTPVGSITESQWDDLIGTNLKVPLFLSQAAAPQLKQSGGSIVNIIDIHSQRPLRNHLVYGAAKAGLAMLTRALAKDLAPEVRVNGISPGAILWPEDGLNDTTKATIIGQIPLARPGAPADIASGVLYLLRDADYVTGQILAIDGGRSVGW